MGLFGKLFDKKECAICGGEIGMLGNRKLEDGNMCKNCTKLLSPWFSDRKNSTVQEIKEQLEYREANKEKVASFRTTRALGENTKVLLDEDAGLFMVTSARNLADANPDVLAFTDVTGCTLDIDESRTEIKRTDREGNQVSYNPPRYKYSYNFYIKILVNNPYFNEIRFRLNDRDIEIEDQTAQGMPNRGRGQFNGPAMGMPGMGMGMPNMGMQNMGANPEYDIEYRNYKEMGEEIRDALLQVRQEARDGAAASAAAAEQLATPWVCPGCGGQNSGGKFCEYCGAPRPQ